MTDITPERIEQLKRQAPPDVHPNLWKRRIEFYVEGASGCYGKEDSLHYAHLLRLLIADADVRETAKPKDPPIPPCPPNVATERWINEIETYRRIASKNIGEGPAIYAHILAALEAYRPGVEMVPIEAFVKRSRHGDCHAIQADGLCTWRPDCISALAAVRESVRKVMAEREPADG